MTERPVTGVEESATGLLATSLDALLQAYGDDQFACGEWTSDSEKTYDEVHEASRKSLAAVTAEIERRTSVVRKILALTETPNSVNDALDAIREIARKEMES